MGGRLSSFFFGRQDIRALIVGLDASGKTTLMYQLKLGEVVTTIPTIGFNVETIEHKNFTLTAWDVGGRDKIRPLLRHYFPGTQVLMFMVDSTDRERLSVAKEELKRYLAEDELRESVVLVLANKQDVEGCLSVEEVSRGLDFNSLTRHRTAGVALMPVSATEGEGLQEAMTWLGEQVKVKVSAGRSARMDCGVLHKVWSVHALLKAAMSTTSSLLYSKTDPQLAGSTAQT